MELKVAVYFYFFFHVVLSADVGDECSPPRGIEWLLHVRKPDYGWGENTHRANIALAVHGWKGTSEEMTMMALQLDEEILKALSSSPVRETDLALFIHALIATQRNPRNFYGIDLVDNLLRWVNSQKEEVNPFLVLALCNAHAVEFSHLQKIKAYTVHRNGNHALDARELEMKALALKALACAATLPGAQSKNLNKFQSFMDQAVKCLVAKQVDGVFGNAYTTSLAVQALTAYDQKFDQKALDYLQIESETNVNVVKKYYTILALNAKTVRFIRDLYDGSYEPATTAPVPELYTSYTIKDETEPDIYFNVIMKIPEGWNFFQVMEKASSMSNRFRFSHFLNENKEPVVYKVIDKPNDAESNMFWRFCLQTNVKHDPHTSNITTYSASPALLEPKIGEHMILWYRNTPCPPA